MSQYHSELRNPEVAALARELNAIDPDTPTPPMAPMSPLCQKYGHSRVVRNGYVYCSRMGCAYNGTPLEVAPNGGQR